MIITLGRNEPNGKYAVAVENENGKAYLRCYKQNNGNSTFRDVVTQIELDEEKINSIMDYYKKVKE